MNKQGFLKGSLILLGMVFITKLLGLVYKIPLAHFLGGTGMGYYSSTYAVFTPLFAVIVSGITSTVARLTAENYAFERYANIKKIKKYSLIFFTILSLTVTILFIFVSPFFAKKIIHEDNSVWSLTAVSVSIIFASILSVERGYFEGLKNMLPTAKSEIIETIFKIIFGLGFAYFMIKYIENDFIHSHECFGHYCNTYNDAIKFSLPFVTAASVLGVSLSTGIAMVYICFYNKFYDDGITKQMLIKDKYIDSKSVIIKKLIKYSLPIAFTNVIITLTNMIDFITINSCISKSIVNGMKFNIENISSENIPNFIYGSYSGLALTIYSVVPTLTAMFGKSILPSLTESWTKKDNRSINKNISDMIFVSSVIAIPSGLGIFFFSKNILEFLYNSRIEEISVSWKPLSVLGIAVIFASLSFPCFSALQSVGKRNAPIIIMIIGSFIKFILNVVLIPIQSININGAAVSTMISQIIVCILSIFMLLKYTKSCLSIKNIFVKPLFASFLCIITALLSLSIISNFQFNHRINLIFSIFNGAVMYIIALWLMSAIPKDKIKIYLKNNKARKL